MKSKTIGFVGEAIAVNYLKNKGYKILETNYTNKLGEIDIVAEIGGVVVFVEVKTRTSGKFGYGREAVDSRKQNKIRLVATGYLKYKRLIDAACRFDVIEITDNNIEHIENAF